MDEFSDPAAIGKAMAQGVNIGNPGSPPPHVARMLIERYELFSKVIALEKFIGNADGPFNTLSSLEQADMLAQLAHMKAYQTVLERRIARADPEGTHR